MTVFESISGWLHEILTDSANGFQQGKYIVDAEALPDLQGKENTAVFSNPNDIQTPMIGGQVRHTSFKTFYVRRNFMDQQARMLNETFFEKLRQCISQKSLDGNYPQDGRTWRGISYQGGIFPSQRAENNEYAIYQVNLKLVYEE